MGQLAEIDPLGLQGWISELAETMDNGDGGHRVEALQNIGRDSNRELGEIGSGAAAAPVQTATTVVTPETKIAATVCKYAAPVFKAGLGSYAIKFASGKSYIGKGDIARMLKSAARISKEYGDKVVSATHETASTVKQSFKDEARKIEQAGGLGPWLYNKINSPGAKM